MSELVFQIVYNLYLLPLVYMIIVLVLGRDY